MYIDPERIICDLHERRRKMEWLDILSHSNAERGIKNDYRGRLVFELFQNSVDRAKSMIWIVLDEATRSLTVANDGIRFSIRPYDSQAGNQPNTELDDFHSLCSIHTSSKEIGKYIGNKGVGFKSVWEYARSARIESVLEDGRFWGFRLFNPFPPARLDDRWPPPREAVDETIKKMGERRIPSFYFPQYLKDSIGESFDRFKSNDAQACTVITLEDIENIADLRTKVEEFSKYQLFFIRQLPHHDKEVKVMIDLNGEKHTCSTAYDGWQLFTGEKDLENWDQEQRSLAAEAKKLEYPIEKPTVAIAFPPENTKDLDSLFYSYLPTHVRCGFNVLIHADFLLDSSRKHIDTRDNPYNKELLRVAARILATALTRKEIAGRCDAPCFLLPEISTTGGNIPSEFLDEVYRELFEQERIKQILPLMFGTQDEPKKLPETSYKDIIHAINEWREFKVPPSKNFTRQALVSDVEKKVVGYFRQGRTPILPIHWQNQEPKVAKWAVPLPELEGDQVKRGQAVFVQSTESEDTEEMKTLGVFETPQMRGLSVTDWAELREHRTRIYLSLRDFAISEVVGQLRMRLQRGDLPADFPHQKILRLVTELLAGGRSPVTSKVKGAEPHCRFLDTKDDSQTRQAQDLAEIYLPCADKRWHPARLTYLPDQEGSLMEVLANCQGLSQVDLHALAEALADLLPTFRDSLSPREVAVFLGSWSVIPLISDENGGLKLPWTKEEMEKLSRRQKELLARLLPSSWKLWQTSGNLDLKPVHQILRYSSWFPLQVNRNTPEEPFLPPQLVFRVLANDRQPLRFFAKHFPQPEEAQFLEYLGVVGIDDADQEKIISQLFRMRELVLDPNDSPMDLRSKYQDLIMRLSKLPLDGVPDLRIPLLCLEKDRLLWKNEVAEQTIWFVPPVEKNKKYHFQELTYAEMDSDTGSALRMRLGLTNFSPKTKVEPETGADDPATKEELQKVLPDLLAIAQGLRAGGQLNPDEVIKRWLETQVKKAEDVYLVLTVEDPKTGETLRKEVGKDKTGDVHFTDRPLCIFHDIQAGTNMRENLSKFHRTLAEGIFHNATLSPHFELFLIISRDEDKVDRLRHMNVTEADRDEAKKRFAKVILSEEDLEGVEKKARGAFR